MGPFGAIELVSSGLTLTAFVVAVIAYVYRHKLKERKELIETAPEEERTQALVATIRDFATVPTEDLTKEQRYLLALRLIEERLARFRTLAVLSVAFALILAFVVFGSYARQPDGGVVEVPVSPEIERGSSSIGVDSPKVEVEDPDSVRYPEADREPCGTLDQPSCNGTRPVTYPETFPEESDKGYDVASAVRARSSSASLANIMSSSVPRECDVNTEKAEQERLRSELRRKWDAVRVSHSAIHSCTKGSSGGRKDCGCVLTLPAPTGFTQANLIRGGTGNRDISWDSTQGRICMWKHGQGRDEGSVTAIWKLSEPTRNARVAADLAYIMSLSSCFNGCRPGLAPDEGGICRTLRKQA